MKALLIAALFAPALAAAQGLPAGLPLTATLDGAELLGFDGGYAAEPGSGRTALNDDEVEFIAADFSLMLDLGSDGRLRLIDNTGDGLLPGRRVIELTLAQPGLVLAGARLADPTSLAGGQLDLVLAGPQTLRLTATDLRFTTPFGAVTAALEVQASPVPAPAPAALLTLGLAAIALRRRR